jgi:outer membrane protein TolC
MHVGAARARRRGPRPHAVIRLFAAAAALSLAACVSSDLDRRYAATRERLDREPIAIAEADVPFAAAGALHRADVVREVLARNPTLRAAGHAWRAALERYPQESSLEDPMLEYGLAPYSFSSHEVDDAHQIGISQALPFPGKRALRGRIALAEAEATGHDLNAARLRLATMASQLYDELWLLDRSLEINAAHVGLLREFRRVALARYEAGEAEQQDPLQAEVELSHLVHRDAVLRSERRVAVQRLNALLHRSPELELPAPPRELEPVGHVSPAGDPTRTALDASPELRAAGARVDAGDASLSLARREFFPDFAFRAMYDGFWQEEEDLRGVVGVEINLPLRLERRRAAVAESRARRDAAQSELEQVRDDVRLAAQRALTEMEEAHHVLEILREQRLPAARQRVAAARASFEAGRSSFLELVDAQRSLRDAELDVEQATAELSLRQAELARALGRTPGLAQEGSVR